jgi:hypothetical protein
MMCKDNFAKHGKTIMPEDEARRCRKEIVCNSYYQSSSACLQQKAIDTIIVNHIIIFTYHWHLHASQEDQLAQARHARATRMLEPAPPAGCRSSVPAERFLRRQRPSPGQVRDVAARADRPAAGQSSGGRVRLFSTDLLSSRAGFSGPGTVRIDSRKAWTTASAQADSPGAGVCATDPIRTAILGHRPSRRRDSRTLRRSHSPTQYRARSGAPGKKTALNQEPAAQGSGATLLAAYEDLRRQVLGGLSSKGLGMFLLLEQGMAAWMRACSATLAVPSNGYLQPAVPVTVVSDLHGEVVRILASMALGQTYSRSA